MMKRWLTQLGFPVLVFMYARLARAEERETLAKFGAEYEQYMSEAPAIIPRIGAASSRHKRGKA